MFAAAWNRPAADRGGGLSSGTIRSIAEFRFQIQDGMPGYIIGLTKVPNRRQL